MQNFDFQTKNKYSVLFMYKVKPKKFIFSNILGNLFLSVFMIGYMNQLFTKRRNFYKYMIVILELFNTLLTLFFMTIYLRLSGISNL